MRMGEPSELTSREWAEYANQKEMWQLSADHAKEMKLLDIEMQKLESKWSTWLKIPVTIITLPVRILMIIPLSIYAATKQEVPDSYWRYLK